MQDLLPVFLLIGIVTIVIFGPYFLAAGLDAVLPRTRKE
jgi:hypothetical protein